MEGADTHSHACITQAPAKGKPAARETLAFDDDDDSDGDQDDAIMDAAGSDDDSDDDDAAVRAAAPALQSNEAYLRTRTRATWSDDDEEDDEEEGDDDDDDDDDTRGTEHNDTVEQQEEGASSDEDAEDDTSEKEQEAMQEDTAAAAPHRSNDDALPDAAETGRLFVRNLAYAAREDDIRALFEAIGQVRGVHLVLDRATNKSKGVAFVEFVVADDAVRALEALDGSIFQGRLLHVLPARAAPATVPPTPDQVDAMSC